MFLGIFKDVKTMDRVHMKQMSQNSKTSETLFWSYEKLLSIQFISHM